MSLQHYFMKCLSRHAFVRNKKLVLGGNFLNQRRIFSSSSDSSDEENGKPKSEIKKDEKAKARMKDLLTSFSQNKTDVKLRSSAAPNDLGKSVKEEIKISESDKMSENLGKSVKEDIKISKSDEMSEIKKQEKSDNEIHLNEETKNKMMNLLSTLNTNKTDVKLRSSAAPINLGESVKEEIKISESDKMSENFGKSVKEDIKFFKSDKIEIKKQEKSDNEIHLNEETKNRMMNLLSTLNKKTYSKDEEIKITQAQPKKEDEEKEIEEDENIDSFFKKAASEVADLLGRDKNEKKEIKSELFQSLQSVNPKKLSSSDIISEMEVSHHKDFENDMDLSSNPMSRLHEFRENSMRQHRESRAPMSRLNEFREKTLPQHRGSRYPVSRIEKIDLLDVRPLNIFPEDFKPEGKESILGVWDSLKEREMKLSVSQPPRNYFEEMINWTEEGKVWTFPIDNEFGLEEEKSYSFADHIFLEKHLAEWCPKKGPIRHFMELVCTGLSKNPYITVNRKKAHIEWYKNYFDSKKDLLQDIGAI